MAFYMDEEQVWKCPKHPSKRRRSGICPTCLRERLITLCPACANTRPCSCCHVPLDSSSSSSSSSSSFSIFQFSRGGSMRADTGGGEIGRVSNLIESEPAFRKSRSLAIPFLRSRSKYVDDQEFDKLESNNNNINNKPPLPHVSRNKIHFWSVFKVSKNKKCDMHSDESRSTTEDYSRMMRSRSVAVGAADSFSPVKRRGWYFPSPIKAFRLSKTSKLQQQQQQQLHELRSPMHRG